MARKEETRRRPNSREAHRKKHAHSYDLQREERVREQTGAFSQLVQEKCCEGRKKPGRGAGTRKSTRRKWCVVERCGAHDPSVRKRPPGSKRLDHSAMHIHHGLQNSREKLFFVQYGRLFFFCQESLESFSESLKAQADSHARTGLWR